MIKFVYVIAVGERGEGHDPCAAYATLADALSAVERNWGMRPIHRGGVLWRANKDNGVDQVEVRRLRVQGGAK